MYEFHGWAVVALGTSDVECDEQEGLWEEVERHVADLELVRLERHNGVDTLSMHGCHNHRRSYVVELFEWLAQRATGSYGVLMIRDQEAGDENSFQTLCLKRGRLEAHSDSLLSPCIPAIEDEYDEE